MLHSQFGGKVPGPGEYNVQGEIGNSVKVLCFSIKFLQSSIRWE